MEKEKKGLVESLEQKRLKVADYNRLVQEKEEVRRSLEREKISHRNTWESLAELNEKLIASQQKVREVEGKLEGEIKVKNQLRADFVVLQKEKEENEEWHRKIFGGVSWEEVEKEVRGLRVKRQELNNFQNLIKSKLGLTSLPDDWIGRLAKKSELDYQTGRADSLQGELTAAQNDLENIRNYLGVDLDNLPDLKGKNLAQMVKDSDWRAGHICSCAEAHCNLKAHANYDSLRKESKEYWRIYDKLAGKVSNRELQELLDKVGCSHGNYEEFWKENHVCPSCELEHCSEEAHRQLV